MAEGILSKKIIEKAWEEPSFMQKLLSDPKTAIREAFGVTLPENLQLKAVQESASEVYFVIPPKPTEMRSDDGTGTNGAW